MLMESLEPDEEDDRYFTRRFSFTEKTKQRLEFYRRRSLPQTNDEGRSSISALLVYIMLKV